MAGKVYVTGDCHGFFSKFNTANFAQQRGMDKDDYVIICGDFGGIWSTDAENREEKYLMSWMENKPFTTLFVDGNHENFDRLNSCPVEMWNGGRVHKIRPSVIHLMRGQVYEIAGQRIFTFGGAKSHDIQGGILDREDPDYREKAGYMDREWISYRINHLSWWKEELPSEGEMQEALINLAGYDYKVDYVITHCCSSDTQDRLGGQGLYKKDIQTEFFNRIKSEVKYKRWYFGHYHMDANVTDTEILLYDRIICLGDILQEGVEYYD
ncbi:MAG: metallophosphoesterase [Lachnospiraceae bacterium]|nr:metallophosphoesterase [Lachnospiraceae bacterium]